MRLAKSNAPARYDNGNAAAAMTRRADAIKVAQPGIGDPSRHNHPRYRHESVVVAAAG